MYDTNDEYNKNLYKVHIFIYFDLYISLLFVPSSRNQINVLKHYMQEKWFWKVLKTIPQFRKSSHLPTILMFLNSKNWVVSS